MNPFDKAFVYYDSNDAEGWMEHSSIYALFTDSDGTVWIGSYYGGVSYLPEKGRGFERYNYNPYCPECLGFPFVGNMVEDKRGDLWICLEGGGLTCLQRRTGTFLRYTASSRGLPHNNLKTICYDRKRDCIYVGTHKGGLSRLDINSGLFDNYEKQKGGGNAFPGEIIDQVRMWNDSLVVSARNGLFIMDGQSGQCRRLSERVFLHFDIDTQGILWGINSKDFLKLDLASSSGPVKISFGGTEGFTLSHILNAGNSVYIATLSAGVIVYDKLERKFTRLNKQNSNILSNYCYNMCQTQRENIAFSTDKGISLYNPLLDKFYNMEMNAFFSKNSIMVGCGIYTCHDNELFVGGTNGMVSFMENEAFKPSMGLKLFFSQLFVNNELVRTGDGTGILEKSLPMLESLSLPYNKNNLLINFATSDVGGNNHAVRYEYRLLGFDKMWTATDMFEIRYTNLPPGHYRLKVRAIGMMNGSMGILHEASLGINVMEAWYATWWAKSLLAISLLCGLVWIYMTKETKRKIALSLEKEQLEKQHAEELHQAKLRFFTNISHEFKTPLTLISTQVEIAQQNTRLPASVRIQLNNVSRYVRQMNELVGELLDFRKIDQNKMKLELSGQNVTVLLKEVFRSFVEYAKHRHIDYRFEDKTLAPGEVWLDVRQMRKVILNLLSNAFKFTPDGGAVTMTVEQIGEFVRIEVADTGIGISDEDLPFVFERFYQSVRNNSLDSGRNGTGIGLALVKSIVELHHGCVRVDSETGEGTRFTIELPVDRSVYEDDRNVVWKAETVLPEWTEEYREEEPVEDFSPMPMETADVRKKVLIVEDNCEIRQMLHRLFSSLYEVVLAENGAEGLERAREEAPDLILSDVMMPEMTGTEMCRLIKSSLDLCHIPVVLLTALDSPENTIEGLRMGADDYVAKPFDTKLLMTRCNNLIRNRRLVMEKYSKKKDGEISMLATNELDRKFLEDVQHIINENMDNMDFDIPFLCRKIGMSRSSFQRKFKALTGMIPNDFVMQYKLKFSIGLLVNEPHLQIGEIADKLGFGSAKYFSRLFKEQFGSTPLEYRKAIRSGGGK